LLRTIRLTRLPYEHSPVEVYARLRERFDHTYLLESAAGPRRLAQYSFIGFDPEATVQVKDGLATTIGRERERATYLVADPLAPLAALTREARCSYRGLRLTGGAVGYISYDSIRYWERIPRRSSQRRFPDAEFGIYFDGLFYNHQSQEAFYYTLGEDRCDIALEQGPSVDPEAGKLECGEPRPNISQGEFEENVLKAKEYIAAGDILQVVLSRRYDMGFDGDLLGFYRALREINPSPYMYFLQMGEREIVGSSPEMLVRVTGQEAETFPIAGTRPRVDDEQKNKALAKELLSDPKERAEHTMLVDLARNDLGRVCQYGTVNVPEFMEVHEFSHVQHIVSHVTGKLREGIDAFDAFRAVFPAGTVSGAPKVRAMEIIEELETAPRGPYAGAVGYFSLNGNSDFAITIRTLVAEEKHASIQAGGGIVADSIPSKEWEETEHKATALLKALKAAGGEKQ
jgi:anthranilate synthase component 1